MVPFEVQYPLSMQLFQVNSKSSFATTHLMFVGEMPNLDGSVRFLYPHHIVLSKSKGLYEDDMPDTMEDDDSDVEDDCNEDEDYVYLYHSLKNDRTTHMLGNPRSKVCFIEFFDQ